jgi:hypothetical protein
MGKKKIGLLALALVLALGALGVGYAAWEDSVTITGTVETGSVDIEIVDYSNTYVWKSHDYENEIYIQHTWDNPGADRTSDPDPTSKVDAFPINLETGADDPTVDPVAYADASAYSGAGAAYDIQVDICNAFPLTQLTADFLLHYKGTVPAKITVSRLDFTPDAGNTYDLSPYVHIKYYKSTIAGGTGEEITPAVGDQWHYCKYILVKIYILLPQEDGSQLQSGTIDGEITVKQWNEVPYTPGG